MSTWRKSTFSSLSECVEVTDLSDEDWRKSSYSVNNGQCAEVGTVSGGVMVRDTADRDGPVLEFSLRAWARFVQSL